MGYFEEPNGRTLYYFAGSWLIHEVPMYAGKQVPASILPSHLSLSQWRQLTQEEDLGQALVDTQAYYILYPKFKQIVSIADGNSHILRMAMESIRETYRMVLAEGAGGRSKKGGTSTSTSTTRTEEGQKKWFTSSNLALDVYTKSNKRIRPPWDRKGFYKNKKY
jgi:hypothetical protein